LIGFYPVVAANNNTCSGCNADCCECTGPSTTECTTCSGSKYLSGNECIDPCPSKTYKKNLVPPE